MNDRDYMLWLSACSSVLSSRKLNAVIDFFGSAENVFRADGSLINNSVRLTERESNSLLSGRDRDYIGKLYDLLEFKGISFISRNCDGFPTLLREIPDPPIGIFIKGNLPEDESVKVAVIGSRSCSEYGRLTAGILARPLARAGIIIVSGMARGVDSVAHRSAIEAGGRTIAVLGSGVDVCYPKENESLHRDIINNGCVISEYPPGTKPIHYNFPARNRIISGLSKGIIVTEAAKKSGTMITVDQAADQGREVFAVPGNITVRLCEGTNKLIKDGAHVASCYLDVLEVLGIDKISDKNTKSAELPSSLTPQEQKILALVNFEPISLDALLDDNELTKGEVYLALTSLEVKGLVKKLSGSRYMKNN